MLARILTEMFSHMPALLLIWPPSPEVAPADSGCTDTSACLHSVTWFKITKQAKSTTSIHMKNAHVH